jgi:hypothetical protein
LCVFIISLFLSLGSIPGAKTGGKISLVCTHFKIYNWNYVGVVHLPVNNSLAKWLDGIEIE